MSFVLMWQRDGRGHGNHGGAYLTRKTGAGPTLLIAAESSREFERIDHDCLMQKCN